MSKNVSCSENVQLTTNKLWQLSILAQVLSTTAVYVLALIMPVISLAVTTVLKTAHSLAPHCWKKKDTTMSKQNFCTVRFRNNLTENAFGMRL